MNENPFPEINLSELKDQAALWAKQYPPIEKITLFKGQEGQRYVLVVEAREPSEPWTPEYREYINNWSDPTGLHIRDDLIRVYRGTRDQQSYLEEWFIYEKKPADPIPDELITAGSSITLYQLGDDYDDEHADYDEYVRLRKLENGFVRRCEELGRKPTLTPEEYAERRTLDQKINAIERFLKGETPGSAEANGPVVTTIKGKLLLQYNADTLDAHSLVQMIIGGLPAYWADDRRPLVDGTLSGTIREMEVMRKLGAYPEKAVAGFIFEISELEDFKQSHLQEFGHIKISPAGEVAPKAQVIQQDGQEHKKIVQGHIPDEAVKLTSKVEPKKTSGAEYFCLLNGEYWDIGFNGNTIRTRDLERLRYIIHLLARPNESISAWELTHRVKGILPEPNKEFSTMSREQLESHRMARDNFKDTGLNEEDIEGLKETVTKIWKNLQYLKKSCPSDKEKIKKAEKDWQKSKDIFAYQYNIIIKACETDQRLSFIKREGLKDNYERARVNAKKQITMALSDFKKYNEELWKHLKSTISTGKECVYTLDPNSPIKWDIRW